MTLKDYSGWQCAAARADLQALGLVAPACEFSWYVPYDSPLVGQVDSQEPAAGTTVARGSTVLLWALEAATTEAECDLCDGYWHCGCCCHPGHRGTAASVSTPIATDAPIAVTRRRRERTASGALPLLPVIRRRSARHAGRLSAL